jgi:tetratricopeptide (TPR) repeat protein
MQAAGGTEGDLMAHDLDSLYSLVQSGQFLAAYREVERLAMDPDLDPVLRAKVFIVGVRSAAALREVYAAAKLAEKAVEAAELGTDWEDIGNARLHSGIIYREIGDTVQALRFFHIFFDHLDRYPTLQSKKGHAYYNLALTHQQRREYPEALESYRLAAEHFEIEGLHSAMLSSLQNSAWVLLLQSQPTEAEPLLARAAFLTAQLEIAEYQASQLMVEALYALRRGDPDRAMALCEEVFQNGREGVGANHLAAAAWIMSEVSLGGGRLHEAGIFADLAVRHALQAKEPQLMNLASDVKQRVTLRKNGLRT